MVLSNLNDPVVISQEGIPNLGVMLKLKSRAGVLGKDLTFLRSSQCTGKI